MDPLSSTAHSPGASASGSRSPGVDPRQGGDGSAAERIADVGFGQWLEEMQARKREELRERILAEMGLTPDKLAEMDGEARARIEALVEQKIAERAAAERGDDTVGEDRAEARENASTVRPGGQLGRLDAALMAALFDDRAAGPEAPPETSGEADAAPASAHGRTPPNPFT
ncbi:hypothetical protein KAJ83_14295 [Marivibrio halodurans]|uniref:Uncharacterized protein n=2 Tax=Marivibrio halodurans TaxID=2039722 RepID=A0A8J7SP87_9PROT|nr:hypothetical protein [Marivibrio halodurans]